MRHSPAILELIRLGLFTKEGNAWKESRNVAKPLFVRAELSDVDGFRKHVDRFMELVPRDGRTIDIGTYLNKLVRLTEHLLSLLSPRFSQPKPWVSMEACDLTNSRYYSFSTVEANSCLEQHLAHKTTTPHEQTSSSLLL